MNVNFKVSSEANYQHPVTGAEWSKEQYDEYIKWEDSRYEVTCEGECYGCEKCEG
jgi:hypothetical protein